MRSFRKGEFKKQKEDTEKIKAIDKAYIYRYKKALENKAKQLKK